MDTAFCPEFPRLMMGRKKLNRGRKGAMIQRSTNRRRGAAARDTLNRDTVNRASRKAVKKDANPNIRAFEIALRITRNPFIYPVLTSAFGPSTF